MAEVRAQEEEVLAQEEVVRAQEEVGLAVGAEAPTKPLVAREVASA